VLVRTIVQYSECGRGPKEKESLRMSGKGEKTEELRSGCGGPGTSGPIAPRLQRETATPEGLPLRTPGHAGRGLVGVLPADSTRLCCPGEAGRIFQYALTAIWQHTEPAQTVVQASINVPYIAPTVFQRNDEDLADLVAHELVHIVLGHKTLEYH
jgi:hypothetical protein